MNGVQKTIKVFAICLAIFIILNIFSLIVFGLSFFIPNSKNDEAISFVESYQNIVQIDLETANSDVVFTTGNEFKVEASKVSKAFSSKVKDQVLKITDSNHWFINAKNRGTIIITVPENIMLEEVLIDAGAGTLELSNLYSNKFELNMGAGTLLITKSKFNETSIEGGAGKIEITDSFLNNLDFQAGVGKVDFSSYITGTSKIECGVGELNINLLGSQENYQLHVEKGIGNIQINGVDQKTDTIFGSGLNQINVEGGVGKIQINFQDLEI